MRAIVVDDEELARGLLREYIAEETDIEVVAECANGFDAVKSIAEHRPDLVFLDVQMPKLTGFEVLELVGSDLAVVFVTAHDQYAIKAFDAAAVDYLLKPFDLTRFRVAMERVRRRVADRAAMPQAAQLSRAAQAPGQHASRIVVKDGSRIHVIPVKDLQYAEAQDDYVALHHGGKTFLKQQTISSLESTVDPECFVRTHRSFIVNIEHVAKIEPYTRDSRVAVLKDGAKIPVSRAGFLRLKELMERV